MIVFVILALFTMKFIWPPITAALDERAQKIREGLSAADKAKAEPPIAEADGLALYGDAALRLTAPDGGVVAELARHLARRRATAGYAARVARELGRA